MDESNVSGVLGLAASLICGIICAAIVAPKQRSGIGWLLLGMVFGPIAIVLAVIAPRLKGAPDDKPSADDDLADALAKLTDLRDRGTLTEAEFESGKTRLLASRPPAAPAHEP
jgi:hypothetical protein